MERNIYILLALYGVVMLIMYSLQYYTVFKNNEKPKNKVHFYITRDKDGQLYLYLGKPVRDSTNFIGDLTKGSIVLTGYHFNKFGLDKNNYTKLKWEDEPLEVFLNMEE